MKSRHATGLTVFLALGSIELFASCSTTTTVFDNQSGGDGGVTAGGSGGTASASGKPPVGGAVGAGGLGGTGSAGAGGVGAGSSGTGSGGGISGSGGSGSSGGGSGAVSGSSGNTGGGGLVASGGTGGLGGAVVGGTVSLGGAGGTVSGKGGAAGAGGGAGTPSCGSAPMALCDGQCVNLGTAPNDCGRCGHGCGGGECKLGVCQPMTIVTAASPISAFTVSPTDVYFATYDDVTPASKLLACPVTGCVLAPRQLVAMQYSIESVAWLADGASQGMVVFQGAPTQSTQRPSLYPCPDTGCVGTPVSAAMDGLGGFTRKLLPVGNKVFYSSQNISLNALTCSAGTCTNGTALGVGKSRPFTTDGVTEYFIDSSGATGHSGYILSCSLAATPPCTPTTVLATDTSNAPDIQVVGSTLYWLAPGRPDYNEGKIRKCTLPACADVSDLVSSLNTPTEMVVDSLGATLINAAHVIQRCVGATCAGGAQDMAPGGTAPAQLHATTGFVYWQDGNLIRRVAR